MTPENGAVFGIDPGLAETGWAVVSLKGQSPSLTASGIIRTSPKTPLPERLRAIHEALAAALEEHRPGAVAVEEMFFLGAAPTIRGTLQARGVVLLAAAQASRPVCEYNPRTVKLSMSGSGRADKAQMQRAVQRVLGLAKKLTPDDVADAAAVAVCHLRSQRFGKLTVLESYSRSPRPRTPTPLPKAPGTLALRARPIPMSQGKGLSREAGRPRRKGVPA